MVVIPKRKLKDITLLSCIPIGCLLVFLNILSLPQLFVEILEGGYNEICNYIKRHRI